MSLSSSVMIRRTENCRTFSSLISPGDGAWEQTDSKSSEWGWTRMMIAHSAVPSPCVTWDDRTSTWRVAGLHTLRANTSKSFRNPSKKKSYSAKERLRIGTEEHAATRQTNACPALRMKLRGCFSKLTIKLLVTLSESAYVRGVQGWYIERPIVVPIRYKNLSFRVICVVMKL
jgi:hypothetical protein